MADELKRGDAALIRRAIATNGGGLDSEFLPRARLDRLLKIGALRFKPCRRADGEFPTADAFKSRAMTAGYVIHGPNAIALLTGAGQEVGGA